MKEIKNEWDNIYIRRSHANKECLTSFFRKIDLQYLNESNQSVEHKGAVTWTEVIIMPHPSSLTVLEHFVNEEDEVKLHKKLK